MQMELERLVNLERQNGINDIFRNFATGGQTKYNRGQGMNIVRYSEDYQSIRLDGSGIVYCDIPYRDTNCGSYQGFNHDRFYEWVLRQTIPVYISEYSMPDDFVMIHGMNKRQLSTVNGASELVTEGIWVSREVAEELKGKCSYQMSFADIPGVMP